MRFEAGSDPAQTPVSLLQARSSPCLTAVSRPRLRVFASSGLPVAVGKGKKRAPGNRALGHRKQFARLRRCAALRSGAITAIGPLLVAPSLRCLSAVGTRSSGRVVEGARLESVYTSQAYRGFESLLLRHPPCQGTCIPEIQPTDFRGWRRNAGRDSPVFNGSQRVWGLAARHAAFQKISQSWTSIASCRVS